MTGRLGRAAALAAMMLAACGGATTPSVTHGWVRLAANPGAPAAAYFTVRGGKAADTLTAVETDMALKAEMHETMQMGSGAAAMSTMAPLAAVVVPAGGEAVFGPGGRHVMLFDVNQGVKPGGTLIATFRFANQRYPVSEALKVVGPGDPAPY